MTSSRFNPIALRRVASRTRVLVALLAGLASAIAHGDPDSAADQRIQPLLRHLDSDSFAERVSAQRALARLAEHEPEVLAAAAPSADPEGQTRLVQALEGAFLQFSDERGDRAEQALMQLSLAECPAALNAQDALRGNAPLRESRARRALERLGAKLTYVHPTELRDTPSQPTAPLTGVGFGEPAVLHSILIPEDWRGTKHDLWHLTRFAHRRNLVLYNIRGSGITHEDLLPLAAVLPGLTLHERGACLGIRAMAGVATAQVHDIVANSAAQIAGLQREDEILKLDDRPVRNFPHLVELLLNYAPGDKVTLQIRRNQELSDVTVRLSSWKDMPQSETVTVPAPALFVGPLGSSVPPPPPLPEPAPTSSVPLHRDLLRLR